MTHHSELLELQPQPTLNIRTRTPVSRLPNALGEAYKSIYEHLASIGELPFGAPYVAYYNMDMEDLDIEIGCPVARPLPARDTIKQGEIPGGRYGATTFTGPYHELSGAYEALTQWVQANKFDTTGTVYEIYLNDPGQVQPHELQTQLLFQLK